MGSAITQAVDSHWSFDCGFGHFLMTCHNLNTFGTSVQLDVCDKNVQGFCVDPSAVFVGDSVRCLPKAKLNKRHQHQTSCNFSVCLSRPLGKDTSDTPDRGGRYLF